jgi:transketolase
MGWFTVEVDGHNFEELDKAIAAAAEQAKGENAAPSMIIMNTIKGKGVNFAEGIEKNHSMNFDLAKANDAIAALKASGHAASYAN